MMSSRNRGEVVTVLSHLHEPALLNEAATRRLIEMVRNTAAMQKAWAATLSRRKRSAGDEGKQQAEAKPPTPA